MQITDNAGKVIEVENLDLALMQADDYRHFRHFDTAYAETDRNLQIYWQDIYNKLLLLKEEV